MDQQARPSHAGLTGRGKNAGDSALHRLRDIRILTDDVRRFTTEFERDVFERLGGSLINRLAASIASREGDFRDLRVFHQRRAAFVAIAGDDIHHTGREPRLKKQLHEFDHRHGSMFGRLDDDGVASRQRRRELPCRQQQWRIPRGDGDDDAERLIYRVGEHARLVGRNDRPFDFVGKTTVIVIVLRQVAKLAKHFGLKLAIVVDLEISKALSVVVDEIANLAQKRTTLTGGNVRPSRILHCSRSSLDRRDRIPFLPARYTGPYLAGERVDAVNPAFACGDALIATN